MRLAGEQSQGNLVPVGTRQRYIGRQIWLLFIAFVSTLLLIEVSDLHSFPACSQSMLQFLLDAVLCLEDEDSNSALNFSSLK